MCEECTVTIKIQPNSHVPWATNVSLTFSYSDRAPEHKVGWRWDDKTEEGRNAFVDQMRSDGWDLVTSDDRMFTFRRGNC